MIVIIFNNCIHFSIKRAAGAERLLGAAGRLAIDCIVIVVLWGLCGAQREVLWAPRIPDTIGADWKHPCGFQEPPSTRSAFIEKCVRFITIIKKQDYSVVEMEEPTFTDDCSALRQRRGRLFRWRGLCRYFLLRFQGFWITRKSLRERSIQSWRLPY